MSIVVVGGFRHEESRPGGVRGSGRRVGLVRDAAQSEPKWFTVSITSVEGVAAAPSNQTATVWIVDGGPCSSPTCTNTVSSVARLENRAKGTIGAAVVTGVEMKAADGGTPAVAWNTAAEPEGWQVVSAEGATQDILVRNDAMQTVVGGTSGR